MDEITEYLEDLEYLVENPKLKEILREITSGVPDFSYMDWNDREYFYEHEYDGVIRETADNLERIIKEVNVYV